MNEPIDHTMGGLLNFKRLQGLAVGTLEEVTLKLEKDDMLKASIERISKTDALKVVAEQARKNNWPGLIYVDPIWDQNYSRTIDDSIFTLNPRGTNVIYTRSSLGAGYTQKGIDTFGALIPAEYEAHAEQREQAVIRMNKSFPLSTEMWSVGWAMYLISQNEGSPKRAQETMNEQFLKWFKRASPKFYDQTVGRIVDFYAETMYRLCVKAAQGNGGL
jgi:hypothetical protein